MRLSRAKASGPPASRLPPSSFCRPSEAITSLVAESSPEARRPISNLAPRRGGEHNIQQAPLDRRADEDLHPGRLRRHALGGLQPDGAVGRARTAGGGEDRHAVGTQRHRALDDVFVTGRADDKLELHVDLRRIGSLASGERLGVR